jgi:hypothetical protein
MLEEQQSPRPGRPPNKLEKEEAWLWRIALLFVILLATGLAAVLWERLENLPYHLGLLSIAVLCVAIAFSGFAYGRKKRVAELARNAALKNSSTRLKMSPVPSRSTVRSAPSISA